MTDNSFEGENVNDPEDDIWAKKVNAAVWEKLGWITNAEKQSTGDPLEPWEGQVEITPEDVAEALRDWDEKAPRWARGLLFTEKPK